MSDEQVKIVLGGLDAWSRGDREGALADLSPEVEFVTSGAFPGLEPEYRGHDGFRRFWRDFRGAWEAITIEIEQALVPRAGEAVILARFRARGRDGVRVERPTAMRFILRDGLVERIISYADWDAALGAAGLARGIPSDRRAGR